MGCGNSSNQPPPATPEISKLSCRNFQRKCSVLPENNQNSRPWIIKNGNHSSNFTTAASPNNSLKNNNVKHFQQRRQPHQHHQFVSKIIISPSSQSLLSKII
ncbi:unnamed protein product [Dracunculus medinensis]|uniref:Uncharacterized protein n=1 Tax=Dracunculus medinensis TaxID=318479 RepID=A0A0N4U278_DRAME|nr:unnamed protein product [Dracunculus medinensis]